jgi:hypothetical protein
LLFPMALGLSCCAHWPKEEESPQLSSNQTFTASTMYKQQIG